MADMLEPTNQAPDPELPSQVARLWPHRECEANIMLGQLCRVGLHWWRRLKLMEPCTLPSPKRVIPHHYAVRKEAREISKEAKRINAELTMAQWALGARHVLDELPACCFGRLCGISSFQRYQRKQLVAVCS